MPWENGDPRTFVFDPNSTVNEGRWRLKNPNLFDKNGMGKSTFITRYKANDVQAPEGVRFIVGKIGGKDTVQAIRFNKKTWSEDASRVWWDTNGSKFPQG